MIDFTQDRDYLRSCARFGLTPSAVDYDDYRTETAADADDDRDGMEDDF